MGRKLTTEDFIKKASTIHNNFYDYSKSIYTKSLNRLEIICPRHGSFFQTPNMHLNQKQGCPSCSSTKKLSTSEFLKRVKDNKDLDYSKVEYKNINTPVEVVCPEHGSFFQTPNDIIYQKNGCPNCFKEKRKNGLRKITIEEHITSFNNTHNNFYDYSSLDKDYFKSKDKIEIICPKHGRFFQELNSHKQGNGCPKCNSSKGEKKIVNFLDRREIHYTQEYKIKDSSISKLRFDFFLLDYNLAIEFDGEQHYYPVDFSGKQSQEKTIKNFKKIQLNDNLKNNYCKENNINLLRIPFYFINNIDGFLKNELEYLEYLKIKKELND